MPAPLVAAAALAGIGRSLLGFGQNRKETRRKKRLIQEAFQNSAARLTTRQGDTRQGTAESLNARGLLQGGQEVIGEATQANSTPAPDAPAINTQQAIRRMMTAAAVHPGEGRGPAVQRAAAAAVPAAPTAPVAPTSTPRTLAGQTQANLEHEFGAEWKDLDLQRREADADVKAASQQGTSDAIAAGINTGVSVYGMGKTGAAMLPSTGEYGASTYPGGLFGKPNLSKIASAMSGIDDPNHWFGGIIGTPDPLSAPGSSWNRGGTQGTMLGVGQTNAEFNV